MLRQQHRQRWLGLGVHVVVASSEDVFADALGGAELGNCLRDPCVRCCDVGMVLGAMDNTRKHREKSTELDAVKHVPVGRGRA